MKSSAVSAFVLVLAVCALVLMAKPASAQLPAIPGAVAVGAFVPTDAVTKNRGGTVQYSVEARYALPSIPLTGLRTILSAGVETGASDGQHSTIVPVTVGEYLGSGGLSPLKVKNTYIGGGVGEYFINQSGISTTSRTGFFAAAGYNTPLFVFAEAKYQFVQRGNGFTVSVGVRF